MFEDTIIAISTPPGVGALGIVRLSGREALSITRRFFRPKKKILHIPPLRPVLGNLYHFEEQTLFEEAYLIYFPAPRTYTKEDMVELSCHGSPVLLEEVVQLGIKAGARLARPGEFTLRAYLNGRIDIIQAQAVDDLIRAASFKQAKISYNQLKGSLSDKIGFFREKLIELLSRIETCIEFPDDETGISASHIEENLNQVIEEVDRLVQSYALGKTYREGLTLTILGRTNAGKSTLFNALLGKNRAIVTPFPGTTRDYLEDKIIIKGSLFSLVDTAGMRCSAHPIENEGVKRGKDLAARSDGILVIMDTSRRQTKEDLDLLKLYPEKTRLIVFNKIDLPQKMNKSQIKKASGDSPSIEISALRGTNLNKLQNKIHRLFVPQNNFGDEVILHQRQKILLEEVLSVLKRSLQLLKEGQTEEMIAEELRKSLPATGELTGEIRTEEVLQNIFNRFCIGK